MPPEKTVFIALFIIAGVFAGAELAFGAAGDVVRLPEPKRDGGASVEKTMNLRRSVRKYRDTPLSLAELSQMLWAAQGITNERGLRTAPSGGALYPLELYVVAGKVEGLSPGVYRYIPKDHSLTMTREGDLRAALTAATMKQNYVGDAPASLVFCAVYERITKKYGERGVRYAHMEAGHAAQNVYLQGVSIGLDTVVVGAFDDKAVKSLIPENPDEDPLYIMPLGKKPSE